MPLNYPKKTVFLARLLEWLAYFYFKIVRFGASKNEKTIVQKILIIEPFQMGDVVALSVLFAPLKELYPKAQIFILTKLANQNILQYDTRVAKTFVMDFLWSDYGVKKVKLVRLWRLLKSIGKLKRKYSFDLGIDCRGDVRSQIVLLLLNCKQNMGYTRYVNSNLLLKGLLLDKKIEKAPYSHRLEWNKYILTLLDYPKEKILPIETPFFRYKDVTDLVQTDDNFLTVVHLGSGWEYKQWTIEKWVELLGWILEKPKMKVQLVGAKKEENLMKEVYKNLHHHTNLAWQVTDFDTLVSFIKASNLVLSLDTGPMNLAGSLGKTCITLFGPGEVEAWYPYMYNSVAILPTKKFSCNPCLQKTCLRSGDSCMNYVMVEDVKKAFNPLLSKSFSKERL